MDVLVCSYLGDRSEQQDAIYAFLLQDRAFAVVADGMGGLENGKIASNTAVRVIKKLYDEGIVCSDCDKGQDRNYWLFTQKMDEEAK